MEIRGSGDDGDPWEKTDVEGNLGAHLADDRSGGNEWGELVGRHAHSPHQHRVVLEMIEPSIVGEPCPGHGGVRCRGDAGEPHRQVVDRFEVPPGGGGHLRSIVLDVQDVADGVGACGRRGAAGPANPTGDRYR